MPLKTCPECVADIGSMTSEELKAHRQEHWEGDIPFPNVNKLAVERSTELDEEIAQRFINEKQSAARKTLGRES